MGFTTSTKNTTHLSSLLGSYTGQTHIQTLGMDIHSTFVWHMMANPLRTYGCELDDCQEHDNEVCRKNTCQNMTELTDWSDVSAFLYYGATIHMTMPFRKQEALNTGGWVGPWDIILAHTYSNTTVDRYDVRYVETPETQLLQLPNNCTILTPQEFPSYLGAQAVQHTIQQQSILQDTQDPYHSYLKNCHHGDVPPILPLLQFEFRKEQLTVHWQYTLLHEPGKDNGMYEWYPTVQKMVNAGHTVKVSGPYCMKGDAKGAWGWKMNEHSVRLIKGCVEGQPCIPSAVLRAPTIDTTPILPIDSNFNSNSNSDHSSYPLLIIGSILGLVIALVVVLVSLCVHSRHSRRKRQVSQIRDQLTNVVSQCDDDREPLIHPTLLIGNTLTLKDSLQKIHSGTPMDTSIDFENPQSMTEAFQYETLQDMGIGLADSGDDTSTHSHTSERVVY